MKTPKTMNDINRYIKYLFVLFSLSICFSAHAEKLSKVIWFTTATVSTDEITKAKEAIGNAVFYFFKVNESLKIRTYFQNQFPKSLLTASDQEKESYMTKNISPKIKAYMPEMMRSEMGVSLAKMYQLTQIPAVVINDKYVTYGMSVSDSIQSFKDK